MDVAEVMVALVLADHLLRQRAAIFLTVPLLRMSKAKGNWL
jgi:hypothetical protein